MRSNSGQRTDQLPPVSISGGSSAVQAGTTWSQRGANAQPCGHVADAGGDAAHRDQVAGELVIRGSS